VIVCDTTIKYDSTAMPPKAESSTAYREKPTAEEDEDDLDDLDGKLRID
jgi:hypothetical protein